MGRLPGIRPGSYLAMFSLRCMVPRCQPACVCGFYFTFVGNFRRTYFVYYLAHLVICVTRRNQKPTNMNTQTKQQAIEKMRRIAAQVVVANADRLAYIKTPMGITCELTRDVAMNLLSRLCECVQIETDANVLKSEGGLAVVSYIIIVKLGDETLRLTGIGEAREDENAARKYTVYRTAETRAIKRALEVIVGSLNPLFIALGRLFERKGSPPSLRPDDLDLVLALGDGKITLDEFIVKLKNRNQQRNNNAN